ncbi:MAG: ABC transporter permease, partial [Acidobacteriota bacterium]
MDRLWQDLRLASRLLWRDRGFALTTIVTLAVCLAANVVIFATVSAVLLRPLPFPDPERIVTVNNAYPGAGVPISQNGVPDYFDRLDAITAFNQFAMYRTTSVTLGGAGRDPERVTSMTVSSSFFTLLSTSAYRGRLLNPEDEVFGQHRQVVLSHGLWERMFGGSDAAVGSDLRINGTPFRIVGVAPPSFRFIDPDVQLWTPAAFTAQDRADDRRHSNNWNQMGRLRDGSTIEQAQAQLDSLNASNLERFPQMREVLLNAGFHTRAAILQEELIADVATTLYLLWGGVVVVLVVGAVNVANLASIRATA